MERLILDISETENIVCKKGKKGCSWIKCLLAFFPATVPFLCFILLQAYVAMLPVEVCAGFDL